MDTVRSIALAWISLTRRKVEGHIVWFAGYIDLFTLSTHVLCLFSSGLFTLMLSQFATQSFVNVYIIVDFNPLSPFQLNLSASLKCSVLPLSFVSWLSVWCLCFTKSVLFLNRYVKYIYYFFYGLWVYYLDYKDTISFTFNISLV